MRPRPAVVDRRARSPRRRRRPSRRRSASRHDRRAASVGPSDHDRAATAIGTSRSRSGARPVVAGERRRVDAEPIADRDDVLAPDDGDHDQREPARRARPRASAVATSGARRARATAALIAARSEDCVGGHRARVPTRVASRSRRARRVSRIVSSIACVANETRVGTFDRCSTTQPFDVVLPVLDEAGAMPSVLRGSAVGVHPDRRRQRLDRRLGRRSPASSARRGRRRAARGDSARRAGPGSSPRRADVVVLHGLRRLVSRRRSPRGRGARARRPRRPRARRPARHRRAGRCTRASANRALAFELRRRTGVRFTDLGPMRAARRRDLLDSGSRTADPAGRSRWCCARPARAGGSRSDRCSYSPRIGRSKVTGTVAGTMRAVHDMAGVLR